MDRMFITFSSAHQKFPADFCRLEHFPKALQKKYQGCNFGSLFTILAYQKTFIPSLLKEAFSTTISVVLFFLKFGYVVGTL